MKKIVMLAVMAAGMVFSATAQESGFGIRASLNLSITNTTAKWRAEKANRIMSTISKTA